MNRVRLLCSRVGDHYHRGPRPDTLTVRCDHCGLPVWLNPETLGAAGGRPYEIWCLLCNYLDHQRLAGDRPLVTAARLD